MILDSSTMIAGLNAPFAPTATGTTSAPDYADLQTPGLPVSQALDFGMGNDWIWYTVVNTTFTSGGSATLALVLQGNPTDATFTSGNLTIVAATPAVPVATLVKGFEGASYGGWKIKYPRGTKVRYVRMQVVIATATMTAGDLKSWLTNDDMQDVVSTAAAYTVV